MTPFTPEQQHYVTETFAALQAIFRTTGPSARHDDLDIVQKCIVRVLRKLDTYMTTYAHPSQLAAALAKTARHDHDRDERVGKGMGARLYVREDNSKYTGRTVESLDVWTAQFDLDPTDPCDGYAQVEARLDISHAFRSKTMLYKQLAWLVDGHGYTVTEAARLVGCSREHASRILSRRVK